MTLVVAIVIALFFTWLLLKIFPPLRKLNWKIIAGLFFFLKLLDVHSTYLCFVKTEAYERESNFVFQLFYNVFGLEPLLAHFAASVVIISFGIFLIKIFINNKQSFVVFYCVVIVFLAVVNNYISYFFFI